MRAVIERRTVCRLRRRELLAVERAIGAQRRVELERCLAGFAHDDADGIAADSMM